MHLKSSKYACTYALKKYRLTQKYKTVSKYLFLIFKQNFQVLNKWMVVFIVYGWD